MKKEVILGCDIGTGSCKVTACYSTGEIINEVHSYYSVTQPHPGYSEQDPEIIVNAVMDCLRRIMLSLPEAPAAVGFSSAMHSLMLVDAKGNPLTNLIVWEDNRSFEIAGKLRNTIAGKRIYEKTGTPVHSMSPLCKIRWFRENRKELFEKAAKFIGIKEFLWYRMFNVYEIDISVGSATGMMDILTLDWNKESLDFCEITASKLSKIVPTTFIRTNPPELFLKETNMPSDMKYCIGASDGCLANFGSGIDTPEKAALTIGTSGAVRITTQSPVISDETMIFNYLLDKDIFVCGGPVNNGGNVLLWLFKTFLKKDNPGTEDFDNLETGLSFIPPSSDGLICIPWLLGERAPVWDEKASGLWLGIKGYHSEFHFFRAALEGICFTLRMIVESIETVSEPVTTLYVSGGFIRSSQWVQMMADITQKKLIISEKADASTVGAIRWTMKSLGIKYTAASDSEEKIIMPDTDNAEKLNRQYNIFRKLYKNNAEQMHELSR